MRKKLKQIESFFVVFLMGVLLSANASGSVSQRIVGGNAADSGEYPWMAVIVDADRSDIYDGHRCGAALIDSGWVVTAAHCVKNEWTGRTISPGDIDVVLGISDLENDGGERVGVRRIIAHPNYDSWTMDSDIALIELEHDVSYNPISPVSDDNSLEGYNAVVIGWGVTEPDGWELSSVLQEVSVPIVSNEICNEAYSQSSEPSDWWAWWLGYQQNDQISDNMLCAGEAESGKDSCAGDSGGPLAIQENGAWKLAGIVSWGEGCAEPGYYGVYTRVSQFTDFIEQWVSSSVAASYCGDFNGDGVVNRNDLNEKYRKVKDELSQWVRDCWSPKKDCGDYTGNGRVTVTDWVEKYSDMTQELNDWIRDCWSPEL